MIDITMLYGIDPNKPYQLTFQLEDDTAAPITTNTAPEEVTIADYLDAAPGDPASSLTLLANAVMYPFKKEIWPPTVQVYSLVVTMKSNVDADLTTGLLGPQPVNSTIASPAGSVQDAIPGAVLGVAGYTATGRMRQFTVGLHNSLWEGLANGQGRPTEWPFTERLAFLLAQQGRYKTRTLSTTAQWAAFSSVPANVVHRVRRG